MSRRWISRISDTVPLEGTAVRLEPLSLMHLSRLCDAGLDEELWRWTLSVVRTPDDMAAYVDAALELRETGAGFAFAIVDRATSVVAGSTRFASMDERNRRLEIGWTWLGREWQRTAMNTETKYLLMRLAFEHLGCVRVEFKTDALNQPSRAALRRIGAREEGILRQHMITAAGRIRDSVYYSVLDSEWPGVKAALQARMEAAAEMNAD